MTITYRPTRIAEVDPAEVMDVYLRRGWRGLERNYGSSGPVVQQLIAIIGGSAAKAQRAACQVTGRRAGGRVVL